MVGDHLLIDIMISDEIAPSQVYFYYVVFGPSGNIIDFNFVLLFIIGHNLNILNIYILMKK